MKFKTLLLWRPKPRHLKSDEEEKAGNSIFLKGEVLEIVQSSGLFEDQKHFVDMVPLSLRALIKSEHSSYKFFLTF